MLITGVANPQVNIYVDAVVNHMCGAGGGEGTHSSCGSWFSAGRKDFPSIPFSNMDFNDHKCRTGSGNIENYGDANQVRRFGVKEQFSRNTGSFKHEVNNL